ncbi:checkpoint protein HUS1 isoform X5 [Rhinatrema bivittatum]|uniref:checkpoint protein HUS1 isoform X5 n=1 Tax=Rhinatrema bivittatum TaxID=194408 RepID=UPI00112BB995|nr:checkpoint protein HUS1 isoform X5 [Rhinatrema bivittatum]
MAACLPRPQWLRACPAPWALPTRGAVGRGLYKMRFRSKIVDVSCLSHFTRIVNTITKLTKACTLRLTDDKLYFILSDKVANGGVSMWCELQQGNFFDEFQMEGVSTEHNDIYLEVTPENLSRALKTAQNAKAVKIKLTKKHCPCLTVAVELPSLSSSSRIVTHDIPVGVIPRKLWSDFREPGVPDFDIIEANRNGEMNLKIETDLVSVTTHFKDLGNPPWVSDDASQGSFQDRDPEAMAEARVDIRKLLQFLAGQQVNPTKAICNIVNNKIVHFILLHEDVSLQYFIPALA